MENNSIAIVEDDLAMRIGMQHTLSAAGYKVSAFENAMDALNATAENNFALVITDLRLPKMSGMELISRIHELFPQVATILITAFPDVDIAVNAIRLGSFDFLSKPFANEVLLIAVQKFFNYRKVNLENKYLRTEKGLEEMVGGGAMLQVFARIRAVADSCAPVLIQGSSGTGKELVANAVHALSSRKDKPFIKINCAALPEQLLESELFGHEKGAFTGADRRRIGKFEAANTGTFFFDEIGDMPLSLQVKLLRILEDGEITRIGGNSPIKVDVRTIFATAVDIEEAVAMGDFREDLSYRVNVVPVRLPDLRDRGEDLDALMNHFLITSCEKYNKRNVVISEETKLVLRNYDYPGNIRELKNIFERAVLLAEDGNIRVGHLPRRVREQADNCATGLECLSLDEGVRQYERRRILMALDETEGKRQQAADLLKITRKVLWKKMKDLDIS